MSEKLTLEDFHTFYLASFSASNIPIMRDNEAEKFAEEVERFTTKLLNATRKAINIELNFGVGGSGHLEALIKQIYGSMVKFKTDCKANTLPLAIAAQVFRKGDWSTAYGGAPWAEITRTAGCIEGQLPITSRTVRTLMVQVDHLIDLWHNTARYLDPYVDFDLTKFLNLKSSDFGPDDFDKATPFMKGIHERWGTGRNALKK